MPREIDVEGVQRLVRERDALVLEVLPAREFEEEHLPGAINVPLKELTEETVADLDRARSIIVYCWDDV
jgi:rhodanese-related sulfurtransferase